ncbi:MAG: DUF4214 domain-containing protein [Lachnospiraceae bacterium]|nr:DUF4214 domain-containing protein [Lachnospiraceae bacterium]
MRKCKSAFKSLFALLLAVAMIFQSNGIAMAQNTVSQNEITDAVTEEAQEESVVETVQETVQEDTEEIPYEIKEVVTTGQLEVINPISEEVYQNGEIVKLEEYNGVAIEGEAQNVLSTESAYLTTDAFSLTTTKKGVQGNSSGYYGGQHTLYNLIVPNCFTSESGTRFDYEGYTYYFSDPLEGSVRAANNNGVTVSVVLLFTYVPGKEVLLDQTAYNSALNGGNKLHSRYYAPAISGEGARYYRAFCAYMAEKYSREDCHIDNWILGNEVNMPNHWHYTGSTDSLYNAELYGSAYLTLYNAVRTYTKASRISISLDHSWQHNDEGRGITAKEFLNDFNNVLAVKQANVDWALSFHLYPAVLTQPEIWEVFAYGPDAPRLDLNQRNSGTRFVDGHNLFILTDYVKENYGANHRIMLTEQGFTQYRGEQAQAASLAYSYYAAKFDPMVDCFILHTANEGGKMNFSIYGTLAQQVYENMDSNQAWVESVVEPVMGIKLSEWVPNYGRIVDAEKVGAFVDRLYTMCLGREAETTGRAYWVSKLCNGEIDGATAAFGFFFSDEYAAKNLSNEEYVEMLYNVILGRESDPVGKADWVSKLDNGVGRIGVYRGFAESNEFSSICGSYGIFRGSVTVTEGRSRNFGLTEFVSRLYTQALGRDYDVDGLDYWCNSILDGKWSIKDASTYGFFHSDEFRNKNLSDGEYVKVLYRTYLGRECEPEGYQYWMEKLASGVSRDEVLRGFADSKEFAKIKAQYGL